MKLFLQITIALWLSLGASILLASEVSIEELKTKIELKEAQIEFKEAQMKLREKELTAIRSETKQLKQVLNTLKKQLPVPLSTPKRQSAKQTDGSSKLGKKADDVPCTCVFNKNRAWNPEKIIWKQHFWECLNYKDDGTCTKVGIVEGAVVE